MVAVAISITDNGSTTMPTAMHKVLRLYLSLDRDVERKATLCSGLQARVKRSAVTLRFMRHTTTSDICSRQVILTALGGLGTATYCGVTVLRITTER